MLEYQLLLDADVLCLADWTQQMPYCVFDAWIFKNRKMGEKVEILASS